MGVEFIETDIEPFRNKIIHLHNEIIGENPKLEPLYERINEIEKEM